METCIHCDRTVFVVSRGLCRAHYKRWHRYGDATFGGSFRDETVGDRLLRYAVKGEGCWSWTGATAKYGHAILGVNGTSVMAHRLAYEAWVGPIPEGHVVRHKCDNPPCINPDHLETGTQAQNIADMYDRNRQKHLSGSAVASSRLTENDVRAIRAEYAKGVLTQAMLGEVYGVSQTTVGKIVSRRSWKHI